MKTLIIGATGLVGGALVNEFPEAVGTYHSHPKEGMIKLDIRQPFELGDFDTVILSAAQPNVEYCQTHVDDSMVTNVYGTINVIDACKKAGAKLVFFSSDYVFSGGNGPYKEDDAIGPINEYGLQKKMAETLIRVYLKDYIIARTSVVYGWEDQGKNFVMRLLKENRIGAETKVPTDQEGNPTYAPNLAEMIHALVNADARGVFHTCGYPMYRYEFAKIVADVFRLNDWMIKPVPTSEIPPKAKRPMALGLDNSLIRKYCHVCDAREGLDRMRKDE